MNKIDEEIALLKTIKTQLDNDEFLLNMMKSLKAENDAMIALLREWLATTHITPVTQYSADQRARTERFLERYKGMDK